MVLTNIPGVTGGLVVMIPINNVTKFIGMTDHTVESTEFCFLRQPAANDKLFDPDPQTAA